RLRIYLLVPPLAIYNTAVRWYQGSCKKEDLRALLFDMDNTLYDNPLYAEHQERVLVEALAHHRGVDVDQQQKDLDEYREQVHRKTGARPSLGNSFVSFGANIALSVEW